MNNRKKRKQIRNLMCVIICVLILLILILIINALTKALKKEDASLASEISPPASESLLQAESETTKDTEQKKDVLTVCIDAGHGGKDIGSDFEGRLEKDDTLKLALAVESYLKDQSIDVVMTRDEDIFWKISRRCKIANDANADYFVSLHRNKGEGYGAEAWISHTADEQSKALAENIMSKLEAAGISRNRGVKSGSSTSAEEDLGVNRDTNMPSCLIELGFLNVADDNQLYDQNLNAYARAIGEAILETARTYLPDKLKDASSPGGLSTESDSETNSEQTVSSTSHTLNNTPIENVESLDNEILDWGQGSNVDEQNRPTGSLMYQDKYGKYNAYFIGEGDHTIYLTFDDGYETGSTKPILDTLKEKNVKAVFFITEPYAKDEPELVQRMIDEGHTVGNHSVTHPSTGLPSMTIDEQKFEIMDNHNYVKEHFNYEMHLFRYPAGKFSEQALAIMNNCNYKSVFWSFAYLDYDVNNQPDPTESLNKCIEKLHPGAIYLLHAESSTNAAILGDFIDQARAMGYEFEMFD